MITRRKYKLNRTRECSSVVELAQKVVSTELVKQGKQSPKQCCRTKSTSSYIVISLQLTKVSTAAAWLLFGLLYASMPLLDVGRKWLPHKPFNRAKKPPKCLQGTFFNLFRFRGFFVSPTFSLFARHLSLLSCYINDIGFPALFKFGMML